MRILFLTPNFPNPLEPTKGMPDYNTARELAARHHEVVVIAPISWLNEFRHRNSGRTITRTRRVDGIEVHHPRYCYPPGTLRTTYGWFLWRSIKPTVIRALERCQPDVVFAGWVHPDGDSALRIAALARAPSIVWSGGSDVLVLSRHPARRKYILNVLTRSDAVVCASAHLKKAITNLGVDHRKVRVLHRGVDTNLFLPGDRSKARRRLGLPLDGAVLLWVGWMVPVKGVDVLIDACAALLAGGLDLRLCLVGDGPLRRALLTRAVKAGVENRVMFVGDVPHDALADWYRAANLTVLSSHSEGVPNVLYESISCGTPFVASDVGGVSEIADPGLDRLVPPGNVRALASAIRDGLFSVSVPTRALVPGSWEDNAVAIEAVFEGAIEAKAAAAAGGR